MTRRQVGFVALTIGIVAFSLAMFGQFGPASPLVALLGIGAALIGLVTILLTLRSAERCPPHSFVLVLSGLGLALHLYETAYLSSGNFRLGFLLWPLAPYVLCLIVSSFRATNVAAIAGSTVVLAFDLYAHYAVFLNPKGSTAGLIMLFIPLWNMLIFAPVAMSLFWFLTRDRGRQSEHAP